MENLDNNVKTLKDDILDNKKTVTNAAEDKINPNAIKEAIIDYSKVTKANMKAL